MEKRILALVLCLVAGGALLCACSGGYTSDRDCVHCGAEPTKNFKTSNGSDCYVCERCSTTCYLCGERSVYTHYTNGFDEEIFVCRDCYEDLKNW